MCDKCGYPTKLPLIYVSGPITNGHMGENVYNGVKIAHEIHGMGTATICPHLSHFYETMLGQGFGEKFWLDIDMNLIDRCDAVFRMEGFSPGGDKEVVHAEEQGIPVFFDLDDLREFVIAWHANHAKETTHV